MDAAFIIYYKIETYIDVFSIYPEMEKAIKNTCLQ